MFLKPFRVKSQTQIKGSDRKKLRAELSRWYPKLTDSELTQLIPAKEEMKLTKIYTHAGENGLIYSLHKNPVFFEIDKVVYPTVYTLWQYPDLIPNFTTWPEVFKKLSGGADLMLPGVVMKEPVTPTTFDGLNKRDICSINLYGNRVPVAMGTAAMSGSDMFEAGMRGKGVHIIHIYGDELWAFGDRSRPPVIECKELSESESPDMRVVSDYDTKHSDDQDSDTKHACDQESGVIKQETEQDFNTGDSTSPSDLCDGVEKIQLAAGIENANESDLTNNVEEDVNEENGKDPVEAMDELFTICFKCALKKSLKPSELPLITSTFYKTHMTPFCPADRTLDIKKSSFKKLSKFLKSMEKEGFIKMKELSKGVDSIIDVDKSHIELRNFSPPEMFDGGDTTDPTADDDEDNDTSYPGPPEITEMFSVTAVLLPLMKKLGYSKGDALTSTDFRKIVIDYVKSNELQDEHSKSHVKLDPILAEIVLGRDEGNVTHLTWEELFSRLLGKMTPVHRVVFPGQQVPVYRKGKVECIKLDVVQRASNKKVTLVENLELFGINPKVFAHAVQVKMGCSSSVQASAQKNKGPQVLIQGNQIYFVANVINEKYGIARKYLQGLEKAPKSGKKR